MTLGLVFWILMLLWLGFSFWWLYPLDRNGVWPQSAFLFVLLLILGWGVFGAPIR